MNEQTSLLDENDMPALVCWYCGSTTGPWEHAHQTPVSRGGGAADNIVDSCSRCNHLKGKLTLDEFREALAQRLGLDEVVFWAEASPLQPSTAITAVKTLQG